MQRSSFLILLFSFLVLSSAVIQRATADTFCRFDYEGTTSYGQVIGERIHALTFAPWRSRQRTGTVYGINQVRLLAPSEPRLIAGLVRSYRKKSVRW
jgi:hypothetical protein